MCLQEMGLEFLPVLVEPYGIAHPSEGLHAHHRNRACLMSLFSKLFGGDAAPDPDPIDYKGFAITPQPAKESGRYRIGALIEKDGQTHSLIRADTLDDKAGADEASINKAKQVIDQVGEGLFS